MFLRFVKSSLFFLLLCFQFEALAQVALQVRVNSGAATTTCTDGFFGGGPEIQWGVNIAGTGWDTYPMSGICFFNAPRTQYTNTYDCASNYPATIQVCLRAFEDDGNLCIASTSCLEQICQNFVLPTPGTSATYTMNVGGASTATMSFTIITTGSFLGQGNDLICDAVNLGTLSPGTALGNSNVSNYSNYCGTNTSEPNTWGGSNDQGVWFQFTTANTPSALTQIIVNSDPQALGDPIDAQLALFQSSNNSCSGGLALVQEEFSTASLNENMIVNCLQPNTTYFLLVDGEDNLANLFTGQEGLFGIEIRDTGPVQAGDLICDALNLGFVTAGGTIGSAPLSQYNICATNIADPTPSSWSVNQGVWYQFQAPVSGSITINATSDLPSPSGFDAIDLQLALYASSTNSCVGVLTELGSSYTPGIFDESLSINCLTPGANYWILVDGSATNVEGIFGITVSDAGISPAPNDFICDAIALGLPPIGGTVGATNQNNYCSGNFSEPVPNNWGNDQGVWYTFIAPASGKVEIRLEDYGASSPDPIDLQVALYDLSGGICTGTLTELESEHDGVGLFFDEDMEVECLVPGSVYWILVDGEGSLVDPNLQEGVFDIEVYAFPQDPPALNSNPCDAIPLGDPTGSPVGTTPGTTQGSQNNFCADALGEPQPSGFTADQTVWYTFIAPSTGGVNISAISDPIFGGVDPINIELAVYSASSCSGPWLEEISGTGASYDIDFDLTCLVVGQTYYIQIDGAPPEILNGDEGYFDLTVTEISSISPPANDLICNAYDFGTPGVVQTLLAESNVCANVEFGEAGEGVYATHTVWYEFIAPASGQIIIQVNTTNLSIGMDPEVYLYSSSDNTCSGVFTLEDSSNSLTTSVTEIISSNCLISGETYFIQVDGQGLNIEGTFDISIENPEPLYGTGLSGDIEPVNNACSDAIVLSVQAESCFSGAGVVNQFNYGQPTISNDAANVSGCGSSCGETWYQFTMPTSGNVLIEGNDDNVGGDSSNLNIIAYSGTCGALSVLACDNGGSLSDPTLSFVAPAGTTIWLQVFNEGGADDNELFELCVSEGCGFDNCLDAVAAPMQSGIPYCFNTSVAQGENLTIDPGYLDCSEGANPVYSLYYYFETNCTPGNVTIDYTNVLINGSCILGITPTDGFTASLYLDTTLCDNAPDALLDCITITACDALPFNNTYTYSNLPLNSSFVLMIDGGFSSLGGDVSGNIMVTIPDQIEDSTFTFATSCNPADTGVVSNTFINQFTCDSVHTITTTLLPSDSTFAIASSCNPADTGVASNTFTNQFTCDSVHTVTTTLLQSDSTFANASSCNPADTGVVSNTFINQFTCDSVHTITTTLLPSDSTFAIASSCNPADTGVVSNTFTNQFTCDSVHMITTTLLQSDSTFANASSCNPADTGVVSNTFINQFTCDSVHTITTTLLLSDSTFAIASSCNPADTGVVSNTFVNQFTCDSAHTVTTTLLPSDSTFASAASCNPADTGMVSNTFANQFTCDSVHTITTTLLQSDSTFANATSCNSVDTGVVSNTFVNQFTCDSVHTVTTTLLQSDSTFASVASCNPADTGVVSNTFVNQFTCDSVHTVTTTLLPSDSTFANATSCNPADTGVVSNTFVNQFTCDSVHTVTTTLLPSDSTFANATSCNPADTGVVSNTFTNQFTCDSVHTVTTTLLQSDSTFASETSCNPADTGVVSNTFTNQFTCDSVHTVTTSLLQSDSTFASATSCNPVDTGVVSNTFTNQFTCDSVHTVTTTLLPSDSTFANATSCNPADTGVVSNTFTNQFTCDSVHTVTTTLLQSDSTFANATSCNPADTGVVSNTFANQFTCDSVHTVTTTILQSDSTFASVASCNPADTGVVSNTFVNQFTCDSVHTVTTTLLPSDSTFANATSCNPADTGVVSNTFTNQFTCDSVHTITTTLLQSDSTFAFATSCNPADTGVVSNTFANQFTCDSVHTVTTTLLQSDSTFASETSCNPADTGLVSNTFTNQFTCDSVHTVTTSLLQSDSTFASATSCNPVDTGVVSNTFTNQFTCDSVHIVTTTLLPSDSTFAFATSCNPADTGVVSNTFVNQFTCDSVHTVTTSLLQSDSTFANATSCNPADTGVVSNTFVNQFTCDSVHTVTTTLLQSDSTFASATSCNPADTGVVSNTFVNQFTCDSVHTVTTTLLQSDSTFASVASCNPADTGVVSNTFTNQFTCDSVHTITTSLLQSDSTFANATSCNPADTGVVSNTFTNQFTCDSVHTVTTTLLQSDSTFANATSCNPADTGVASNTFTNQFTCDSVHTVTTTLLQSDSTFSSATSCNPADTGVVSNTFVNQFTCDSVHTVTTTLDSTDGLWTNTPSVSVCDGFNVSLEVQASGFTNYQWYVDSTGIIEFLNESVLYEGTQTASLQINLLEPNMDGHIFVLEMSDNCGDFIYDSIQLNVFEPLDDVPSTDDFEVCLDADTVVFFDYVGSNASWSNGDFGPNLQPLNSGAYIVNYTDDSTNCIYTDTINIEVLNCIDDCDLFLPTAFSPGVSLGMNDLFRVLTNCDEGFSNFEFQIYNRWGELVYLSTDPAEGWDGIYGGNPVPIGVYTYYLSYTKNITGEKGALKGSVTLIK